MASFWLIPTRPPTLPTIPTVQIANPAAGISVVSYRGSANALVAHGLGTPPSLIIAKSRSQKSWPIYAETEGINRYLLMNSSATPGSATGVWGGTAPTNAVFGKKNSSSGGNTDGHIVGYYCIRRRIF